MDVTKNCQLTQWALTDRIRMDDFNSDNLKLDAELALLREHVFSLAYYAGLQILVNQIAGAYSSPQFPILTCALNSDDQYALEGGVTVSNHVATLTGSGASGSLTIHRGVFNTFGLSGRAARLWVHVNGWGTVTPYLNGAEMRKVRRFTFHAPTHVFDDCLVFSLDAPYSEDVTLRLEAETSKSLSFGDIIMAQL